jgi:O-antigen ligase
MPNYPGPLDMSQLDAALLFFSDYGVPLLTSFAGGVLALALCLTWLRLRKPKAPVNKAQLMGRLFGLWLVSTALFTGWFGALRIPGVIDLSLDRMLLLAQCGVLGWMIYKRRIDFKTNHTLDILLGLFLLLCLFSMTRHGFGQAYGGDSVPWSMFLTGYLMPAFAFFVAKYVLDPERDYDVVFKLLFIAGFYISIVAALEHYDLKSFIYPRYIADPIIDFHLDRARGPFLNAAFNGLFLCICFVTGVYTVQRNFFSSKYIWIGMLLLFPPAIFFTRTRSVYLCFLLIIFGLLFCYKSKMLSWKMLAIYACIAFALVISQGERFLSKERTSGGLMQMSEVYIRLELMRKSLGLIAEKPLLGIGFGRFRSTSQFSVSEQEYQHNHLVGLGAELGLIGLGLFLSMLCVTFSRFFSLLANAPEGDVVNSNLLLFLGLGVLVNITSNTFVEPVLHPFANSNLFMFIGMIDRLHGGFNRPKEARS